MIVDAHQHFWQLGRGDYAFPAANDPVLYRDFLPSDLEPTLAGLGIARTVLVQATDTLAETEFLLGLARQHAFIGGVVGWCDPRDRATVEGLLALPPDRLVGVRPMLQRFDSVEWLIEEDVLGALRQIAARGLVFDALVDARHLADLQRLCEALPDLVIVIDHMAKPWRVPDRHDDWRTQMRALATTSRCLVKVSGFPFANAGAEPWRHLDSLVADLVDWFGPDRLLWGSDWPVVEREGGYPLALTRLVECFPDPAVRDAVFARNAIHTYGISL